MREYSGYFSLVPWLSEGQTFIRSQEAIFKSILSAQLLLES